MIEIMPMVISDKILRMLIAMSIFRNSQEEFDKYRIIGFIKRHNTEVDERDENDNE